MTAPLRIALAGAHGTGKSTLLRNLSARLPHLAALPEQARAIMVEWKELAQDMTAERRAQFQDEVMRRSLAQENAARERGFVSDRCVIDNLAYAQGLPSYPALLAAAKAHLATRPYTHVFLVKKMFPPKADGLRTTDEAHQEEIERRIVELFGELGVPHTVVTSFGKMERVEEVLKAVGIPARPIRLTLVGPSGTGKTTLCSRIVRRRPDLKELPDVARQIIAETGAIPKKMDDAQRGAFEAEILRRQVALEAAAGSFVADRGLIDVLAYSRPLPGYEDLLAACKAHFAGKPYTHVVLFPRMFFPQDDGVRTLNETHRREVEERFRAILAELKQPHYVLKSHVLEERLEEVMAYLNS